MSQQYHPLMKPGAMVGEDVHPVTGKPLSSYHPLMTPGQMVGEDMPFGPVIATPRKTQFEKDSEALDKQGDSVKSVDKVFRDPEVNFQLVPENDWSAVDAKTMGMSTPDILTLQQGGSVEPEITGTNTGTGDREAPRPAPVVRDRMADASEYDRMSAWAKANPTLAAKVKPGQAGYEEIQKYLNPVTDEDVSAFKDDSGYTMEESEAILGGGSVESVIDGSGISTTITTPQTTSNPESPQDGANPYADISDQYRVLDIPNADPQEFKSSYMNSRLGEMLKEVSKDIPSTYFPK